MPWLRPSMTWGNAALLSVDPQVHPTGVGSWSGCGTELLRNLATADLAEDQLWGIPHPGSEGWEVWGQRELVARPLTVNLVAGAPDSHTSPWTYVRFSERDMRSQHPHSRLENKRACGDQLGAPPSAAPGGGCHFPSAVLSVCRQSWDLVGRPYRIVSLEPPGCAQED